jgi:hypothetical protein
MNAMVEAPAGATVKINNRTTDDLPDILDNQLPLVKRSVALIAQLAARDLTPDKYQRAVRALHEELDLPKTLAGLVEQTLAAKEDVVLYRRTGTLHRETIQLFFLDPSVFHPPHCHHNILSTQLILRGKAHIREFDRIARVGDDKILMRLRRDAVIGPGDALRASEIDANCHWFGAVDGPVVMLNFNAYGYQDWTFNPRGPLRRKLVDPTFGLSPDGLTLAKEISIEQAYAKFGGRPLSDFPMS